MMHGTQRHINTLQYDARYTQRHINILQYDARYTRHQIEIEISVPDSCVK